MQSKENIIKSILDLELEMFLAVKSLEPASCQQNPQRFRNMRKAQFLAWSRETLESYLQDIQEAIRLGKNLMTLKYARMDNLIPPINTHPAIHRIAEVQLQWQREMASRYPKVMSRGRTLEGNGQDAGGASFKVYLMGELETYSHRTLELLETDVRQYLENNENMTQVIYEYMVTDLGYISLEEAETLTPP
ncbi:MAG: DUF4125 family protein [Desulfatibacillum sp.]|nr:DUF4125 family protein [Desulfatibacillum sp.]